MSLRWTAYIAPQTLKGAWHCVTEYVDGTLSIFYSYVLIGHVTAMMWAYIRVSTELSWLVTLIWAVGQLFFDFNSIF